MAALVTLRLGPGNIVPQTFPPPTAFVLASANSHVTLISLPVAPSLGAEVLPVAPSLGAEALLWVRP